MRCLLKFHIVSEWADYSLIHVPNMVSQFGIFPAAPFADYVDLTQCYCYCFYHHYYCPLIVLRFVGRDAIFI